MKNLVIFIFSTCLFFTAHTIFAKDSLTQNIPVKQESIQPSVVSLNHATLAQLQTLKGVGEKRAEAILAYKSQMGSFKSVDDLLKVKGIGEKVLLDNKTRLTI